MRNKMDHDVHFHRCTVMYVQFAVRPSCQKFEMYKVYFNDCNTLRKPNQLIFKYRNWFMNSRSIGKWLSIIIPVCTGTSSCKFHRKIKRIKFYRCLQWTYLLYDQSLIVSKELYVWTCIPYFYIKIMFLKDRVIQWNALIFSELSNGCVCVKNRYI